MTLAFLEAQEGRVLEELSEGLAHSGDAAFLPAHRALFRVAVEYVRAPSHGRAVAGVRRTLAGADLRRNIQPILSGQVALWTVLHRRLREVDGPHRAADIVHAALALVGDTVDGITGALVDFSHSGQAASDLSAAWDTLVELGRVHREFRMLNRVIHDLLDVRDPARMFEILESGILETFHLRSLVIAAVNRAEGFVEVVRAYPLASTASRDPIGWRYDLSHPDILCDVARTGRVEIIDGWDPRYHEQVVQPDGSAAIRQRPGDFNAGQTAFFIPILARNRTIGVVCTASTQADRPLILRQIERMRPFLHQVGMTLSIVSEIIERQRAEVALREANQQLTEASRLKGEFLTNTTHELRTPMTNIIGSLQTVLDGLCPSREEEVSFLRGALVSSQHLLTLINDLLDVSRIEADKIDLDIGEVYLWPIFREVERIVADAASEKALRMRFAISGSTAVLRGDPVRVQQVLINLVGNAVKFTPEGGEVHVTAKIADCGLRIATPPQPSPEGEGAILPPSGGIRGGSEIRNPKSKIGRWVEVEVADTGIGVPKEMQGFVFEKFAQVDGSATRRYGGVGLGLYICRSLIERMGGEIGLESEGPGRGTRVFFRLPVP
jgi:signal transduction histidine kinase